MNILTVNLLFSTLVFWIAARLYVLPKLDELRPRSILLPIWIPAFWVPALLVTHYLAFLVLLKRWPETART
jgi:hypothetical protein